MSKKTIKIEVNRSSKTGRFVTEQFSKTHPSTTETQHIKKTVDTQNTGNKNQK